MRRRRFAYEHSKPVLRRGGIRWGRILILVAGVLVAVEISRPDRGDSSSYGNPTAFTHMSSGESDQGRDGLALLTTAGIACGVVYKILTLPTIDPASSLPPPAVPREIAPLRATLTMPEIPAFPESFDWDSINWESVKRALDESLKSKAAPKQTWNPPPDSLWLDLLRHPCVVLILGRRGSGKSGLGYRIIELMRHRGEPYIVGLPAQAQKHLPDWAGTVDRLEDVPPKAVVLVDESYLHYPSRASMDSGGRDIGSLINLSRQRDQTLIFVVQEARQLDVNIVSQIDVLAVKELSDLSRGFERPQLRGLTDKARAAFRTVHGDRRRWSWVYSEFASYQGLVSNELATFWKPRLSCAFTLPSGDVAPARRGQRPSREELQQTARRMREAGLSFSQIARNLGVSKTQAWRLVNDNLGSQ